MQKITKIGEPALFIENAKDVKNFLPNSELLGMRLEGQTRVMIYDVGEYKIEVSNKKKGVYIGDVCAMCGMGEVVDAGGCATCSQCFAQLKCGL